MTTNHKTKWRESLIKQDTSMYDAIKRDQEKVYRSGYLKALEDVIERFKPEMLDYLNNESREYSPKDIEEIVSNMIREHEKGAGDGQDNQQ